MKQHRPRNRKLHVQPLGKMPARIEQQSSAGEVESLAHSRIQHTTATDQLPLDIEMNPVPAIRAAIASYRVDRFCILFFPAHVDSSFLGGRLNYPNACCQTTVMAVLAG